MDKKEMLNAIWEKLDYWCEQYKIANEIAEARIRDVWNSSKDLNAVNCVIGSDKELERISKNIKDLEEAYKTIKTLF